MRRLRALSATAGAAVMATGMALLAQPGPAGATTLTDSWATRAAIPVPSGGSRLSFGTTLGHDGRIYVVGGDTASTNLTSVYAYDPATDSWVTSLPPLPQPRDALPAATGPDGTIYAIGGYSTEPNPVPTSEVDAWNPATDTAWHTVAPLPVPLEGAQAVASGGAIYVFGGGNNTTPYSRAVYAYAPASDSWTHVTDLPSNYANYNPGGAALASDGHSIYIVGGYNSGSGAGINLAFRYDPTTSTWSQLPNLPLGRTSLAATTGGDGRLYVIGGADASVEGYPENDAYDPTTNTWTQAAPLPSSPSHEGRSREGAVTGNDGLVYVVGGEGDYGPTNDTMVYGGSGAPLVKSVTVTLAGGATAVTFGNCAGGSSTANAIGTPNGTCTAPSYTVSNSGNTAEQIVVSATPAAGSDGGPHTWQLCGGPSGSACTGAGGQPGTDQYALTSTGQAGSTHLAANAQCDAGFDGCSGPVVAGAADTEQLGITAPSSSTDTSPSFAMSVTYTAN